MKYNAGNIYSVANALLRLGVNPVLTDDIAVLRHADKVLFPGQGEAGTTMRYIKEHRLDELIRSLRQPVLGICIGQQLLCGHSEENDTSCIGIFPAEVKKFVPVSHDDKVPQMGWNSIYRLSSPLFAGIRERDFVYNVHSYYVPVNEYTIAVSDYITPYSAAMRKGNFFTCQFHPEKSGSVGDRILRNFINMKDETL